MARLAAAAWDALARGEYYEAEQKLKTVCARLSAKRQHAEAAKIAEDGACRLLEAGESNSGLSMAEILLDTFPKIPAALDEASTGSLIGIFSKFSRDSAGSVARVHYIKACIKWATAKDAAAGEAEDRSSQAPSVHTAKLHAAAAKAYHEDGDFATACSHFLYTTESEALLQVVIDWAQKTPAAEHDLLVARTVLQLLCLGKLREAHIVLAGSMERLFLFAPQSPTPSKVPPLLNLLRFFIAVVVNRAEWQSGAIMKELRTEYMSSLERDPKILELLDHSMLVLLGVRIPTAQAGAGGNMMQQLMQSLMQGQTQM